MDIPSTPSLRNLQNHFQTRKGPKDWNLEIKQHAKSNNDHAILSTFTHMETLGVSPDKSALPLVLKACARLSEVDRGREIHRSLRGAGLTRDVRVGTALVDFYAKSGLIEDAREVFDEMPERDLVSWNAMLFGYVACCFFERAVLSFTRMRSEGLRPNSRTLVGLISALKEVRELRPGQEVHGYCLRNGLFDSDPHVGTALIGFYSRFDVGVSLAVFDSMSVKNIVSWNAIITGCIDVGENFEACSLFLALLREGIKFDYVTLVSVVQACAVLGYLDLGIQIHQLALKSGYRNDLFVVNALLNMYSECGSLDLALRLFENAPNRDLALWNSMIDSYIKYWSYDEAVRLFLSLREEGIRVNERTVAVMLPLCPHLADGLRSGKSLHAHAVKSGIKLDVSLGNAFLGMYSGSNCVESAQRVFGEMKVVDVVSWNTLIMALASNGLRDEVWNVFEAMRASKTKPNSHTIISILASCHDETCMGIGRALHGYAAKHGFEIDDTSLNTALTDMYMACGDEATAMTLFESCPDRDVISWNSLIASYVKNDWVEEARSLFRRMVLEVEPNVVTIVNMLSSCTHLAALSEGQSLHAYVTRRQKFEDNLSLANALVTMYARCGSIRNAEQVFFELLPMRNIISWNALITGFASHGLADKAIHALSQMLEDGLQPNSATFIAILSACRHSGYVDKGLRFFHIMVNDFKIKPELVHYGCVVDLLCRGGRLNEARDFIESLPIEPDASLWRALLSSCRVHSDAEFARTVFEKLVELEPLNPGNYVLLSNIYASAGLWQEVRKIRATIQDKGLRKSPGISWIVVRSQVHCFAAGDTSHPQSEIIYENLNSLTVLIKESGCITDFHFVLNQEEDEFGGNSFPLLISYTSLIS